MRVSQSKEDYLERIQELIDAKGYARVADIAKELEFSRSSVTIMIQQLSREGYLNYEKYRGFTLTESGRKVAKNIRDRHTIIRELFEKLGVDAATAENDIEGIEHHVSDISLKRFKALIRHLEKHPLAL